MGSVQGGFRHSCQSMNRLCEYAALNDESADGVHEFIRVPTGIEWVTHTSKGACQNTIVTESSL